jgi:hypothetical protein
MKKLPQHLEDSLHQYIDGTLNATDKQSLDNLLSQDVQLKKRLEELRAADVLLKNLTIAMPSKTFTSVVMDKLDHFPLAATHSIRKGLLLFGGVIFILTIAVILLSAGVFDQTTTVDLNQIGIAQEYIKQRLPRFSIDGNILINTIILLNLAIAFVVLDRAVLKPFFQRRMQSGQ